MRFTTIMAIVATMITANRTVLTIDRSRMIVRRANAHTMTTARFADRWGSCRYWPRRLA